MGDRDLTQSDCVCLKRLPRKKNLWFGGHEKLVEHPQMIYLSFTKWCYDDSVSHSKRKRQQGHRLFLSLKWNWRIISESNFFRAWWVFWLGRNSPNEARLFCQMVSSSMKTQSCLDWWYRLNQIKATCVSYLYISNFFNLTRQFYKFPYQKQQWIGWWQIESNLSICRPAIRIDLSFTCWSTLNWNLASDNPKPLYIPCHLCTLQSISPSYCFGSQDV